MNQNVTLAGVTTEQLAAMTEQLRTATAHYRHALDHYCVMADRRVAFAHAINLDFSVEERRQRAEALLDQWNSEDAHAATLLPWQRADRAQLAGQVQDLVEQYKQWTRYAA